MNMEEGLYKALATVILENKQDQYGNTIQSPLSIAIDKWADKNKEAIAEIIIKNISVEKFASLMEERIVNIFKRNIWNYYDKEKYFSKLDEKVMDKMATLMAEESLKKLKEDKQEETK